LQIADFRLEELNLKSEGLLKKLKGLFPVISAQAGIQSFKVLRVPPDSRFHGNDKFLGIHQI